MKTIKILFSALILFAGAYVYAQSTTGPQVRLHGYALYAFDDKSVDSYYSASSYFYGTIKGGFQYGGGLEVKPYDAAGFEITYLRLDSQAPLEYFDDGVVYTTFDLAQNWVLASFNKYLPVNDKIEPYAAAQIGMNILNVTNPDNGSSDSVTKFAWGIKAGVNIFANEKVGFKLQMSLLSVVQAVGGGLYFGTGGAGAGVSGFSSYYQFSLGGGLVFGVK
jgi:hypothetical protein